MSVSSSMHGESVNGCAALATTPITVTLSAGAICTISPVVGFQMTCAVSDIRFK
jgi:hypothetical protein